MKLKKAVVFGLLALIIAGLIVAADGSAEGLNSPFPSYGSGPVEVRIYSDYFCLPCRTMEPVVEPILKDLLTKNAIRLTLVDTPLHPHTALFARLFLYALKKNNDVNNAFRVRQILFDASMNEAVSTQGQIETIFREKGIPYEVFDPKPLFEGYSALLREDSIKSTPSCVIVRNGQKKALVGGPDVVNALKSLQ